MSDIRTQITEHVDGTVPPIDIDRLVAGLIWADAPVLELTPEQDMTEPWWKKRWVPVMAGAMVAVAVVGLTILLNGPAESLVTVESTMLPSATTPASDPVAPVAPVPGPWTMHRVPGSIPFTSSVTAGGPGLVAVGMTFTQGEVFSRGAIWTSADGVSWTQVVGEGLFEEGHLARGTLGTDAGVVVWGENVRQGGTVIWHSATGSDWTLVGTGDPPLDGFNVADGLALASGGYLLYGKTDDYWIEGTNGARRELALGEPRLLVSRYGISWEQIPAPIEFTAMAQVENGDLLASGGRISEPTTWISRDEGRTWALHGPDRTIETGEPSALVWAMLETPYGLVAAGVDGEGQPTMWLSDDGKTFAPTYRLPVPPESDARPHVSAIAFGEGWVVAVGGDGVNCCPDGVATGIWSSPAMWVSQDGREWQEVSLTGLYGGGGGGLSDIVYLDSVFIAVGDDQPGTGSVGLVLRWEADPE